MSNTTIATSLLRSQYRAAHNWLEGTLEGVTNEVAAWRQPGRAFTIGAHYLHHVSLEDVIFNMILSGGTPLRMSAFEGKTGGSDLIHLDEADWCGWARAVKVDVVAAREYAQAVFAATDRYLASLHDDELGYDVDLSAIGMEPMQLGALLSQLLGDCHNHCGEISCLKGLQDLQGYPS
jgi:DinB family protein